MADADTGTQIDKRMPGLTTVMHPFRKQREAAGKRVVSDLGSLLKLKADAPR
jgi:hypothetical protein